MVGKVTPKSAWYLMGSCNLLEVIGTGHRSAQISFLSELEHVFESLTHLYEHIFFITNLI